MHLILTQPKRRAISLEIRIAHLLLEVIWESMPDATN